MKRLLVCGLLSVFFLCLAVHAEMRTWTSKKGDTVEAEYVKMYGSKVVLKTADGRTLRIPPAGLSDDDQEYLSKVATVPPTILVSVSEDMESDKNSSGYPETLVEMLTLDVNVRKRNPEPCSDLFKVELYILGREKKNNQYYSIIDIVRHDLTFAQGDLVSFQEKFTIRSEVGYSWSSGFEYKGYLCCVKDEDGEVVALDCNQNIMERNLGRVLRSKRNDTFNEDFVRMQ